MKLGSAKKLTDPERGEAERGEGEERAGEVERGLGSTPGGRCKMAAAAPKRTRLLRRDPPATQASARPLVKSSSPDDEEEEEEGAAPVVRWSSSMLLGCLELVSPEDESREKKDGLSPAPGTSRRAARNPPPRILRRCSLRRSLSARYRRAHISARAMTGNETTEDSIGMSTGVGSRDTVGLGGRRACRGAGGAGGVGEGTRARLAIMVLVEVLAGVCGWTPSMWLMPRYSAACMAGPEA